MSVPEAGNALSIPAYTPKAEDATVEIEWSQTFKTREATYYIVCAKKVSKGNADIMLFIQDRFYKDESSPDYIDKILGATKDGGRSRYHLGPLCSPSDIATRQLYRDYQRPLPVRPEEKRGREVLGGSPRQGQQDVPGEFMTANSRRGRAIAETNLGTCSIAS